MDQANRLIDCHLAVYHNNQTGYPILTVSRSPSNLLTLTQESSRFFLYLTRTLTISHPLNTSEWCECVMQYGMTYVLRKANLMYKYYLWNARYRNTVVLLFGEGSLKSTKQAVCHFYATGHEVLKYLLCFCGQKVWLLHTYLYLRWHKQKLSRLL